MNHFDRSTLAGISLMAHYVEDKQMKKMRVYNDSFTAGRYSLPRFGRELEDEPHIVIPLFYFVHAH